jgi:transcriptional regulator with XRE-family HTH domain
MESDNIRYQALGRLLAQARRDAGYQNQSDLATLLKTKQQNVSRWEAGTSRPRPNQIAELAKALKIAPALLLDWAGYSAPVATISFDHPFPLEQLLPETFERLVEFVVERVFEGARVGRAGTSGHTQDGLDVKATLPDGTLYTFQCKRQKQFGPAEAKEAIKAHTAKSNKKHLVLSRVASPQTAEVLEDAGWEVWDKERFSQIIRGQLTPDDQDRLVDIFFPGKRFELLGRSEPGPWQTTEEFFAPFVVQTRTFSHTLELQGRRKEIAALIAALEKADTPIVMLTGAGGIGKSRLLKEALHEYSTTHPAVIVRLLSVAREAKSEDLEKLTRGPKVLVVDDAHDRDGLGGLIHFAADPDNQTRLLLATRPYAESRLRRDAAAMSIEISDPVKLERLSRADSIELAKAVLAEHKVSPNFAESIVDHVGDNPLVTVMAARVIAAEGMSLEAAKNSDVVRDTVLGKFKKVVIGDLGLPGDEKSLRGILDVLALVQPFHIEDPALVALLETLKGIDKDDSSRLLRVLLEGGLIYRRGRHYRLMPDLLGDYIIEGSCVGPGGKLSSFAERAFDAVVESKQIENVLVNLGRLDWRLSNGNPSQSALLDGIWRKLRDVNEEYDPRLDAISAVAIYQPSRALEFVEHHIREQHKIEELPQILRSIAFNIEYTEKVCDALWELGKNETKDDGHRFENPMKVLEKLCGFQEHKPLEFCERVFNYAMTLSENDEAWKFERSPLSIMLPVLSTEGMSTTSTSRTVTFKPFLINYKNVKPLRERLITHMLELLEHKNIRIARRTAAKMDQALRGPWRAGKSVQQPYDLEFEQTIKEINDRVRAGRLQPVVLMTLAPHMSWMAEHDTEKPKKAAQEFLELLPKDLEFRLLVTLVKGNGSDLSGREFDDGWQERNDAWIKGISAELKARYTNDELLEAIEDALQMVNDSGTTQTMANVLIYQLMSGDLALARTFIATERERTKSQLRRSLAPAVLEVLSAEPAEGRAVVKKFLESADDDLAWAAAFSFRGLQRPLDEEDVALLKSALSSPKPSIVQGAIQSLWNTRINENPRLMIDLTKAVHFEIAPRLADEVFMMFRGQNGIMSVLTKSDVEHFLRRLRDIPEIDGYHTQNFLAYVSENFPFELLDFYLTRIDIATERQSYSFRPANFGPYSHTPLRFNKSAEASSVLAHIWSWLRQHSERKDYVFNEHTVNLFEAVFPEHASADLAEFFDAKVNTASAVELDLMGRLLHKVAPDFIFTQRAFVVRYLDRCRAVDPKLVKAAISSLVSATLSGVRGGTVGQPFERDLRQRDESKKILATLSRLSPAYELYDYAHRSAERDIAERSGDIEALDDE